ncbi:MAG: hypothetical protein IJ211_03100 [Campylobacter sp.]|nr:hypothetical protein [Campylobacter sp.]
MLLSERLKNIGFHLIDLAEFLKISRPTLYKFINLYEIGQKDNIDGKILKFFDLVCNNENITKIEAMAFVLNNTILVEAPKDRVAHIGKLLKKENKVKIDFIDKISKSDIFDPILEYLLECEKICSKKRTLSKNDIEKIEPLRKFYLELGLKLNFKGEKNA